MTFDVLIIRRIGRVGGGVCCLTFLSRPVQGGLYVASAPRTCRIRFPFFQRTCVVFFFQSTTKKKLKKVQRTLDNGAD